jgi:hypothetical protein
MRKPASSPSDNARYAIIAWTPAYDVAFETRGQVLVGQWQPRATPHSALQYANIASATIVARRTLSEAEALRALGSDHAARRADGIPADAINLAFASIEGWEARRYT